jgi:hypothetical protein
VGFFGWGRFVAQNHSRPNGGCSDEREQSQDDDREWRGAHAVILAADSAQRKRAAAAPHVAVYIFCRIHVTNRGTPATAAGVIDRLWGMDDLCDAVIEHAA